MTEAAQYMFQWGKKNHALNDVRCQFSEQRNDFRKAGKQEQTENE